METRLDYLRDETRSRFWIVPALMAIGAALLAGAMVSIDIRSHASPIQSRAFVYDGGPVGANTILSAIAGATISVAGTTFAITIAVLALTSGQFGSRLSRTFVRDRGNQAVLGTYVATFIYCLLVLRTVRAIPGDEFVPHLSVTVGMLLALLEIAVLIYFVHHTAGAIQVPQIIAHVARDLDASIARLFPESLGVGRSPPQRDGCADVPTQFEAESVRVLAARSGYVQMVLERQVMELTSAHDLIIRLECQPGVYVRRGMPLLRAWPATGVSDAVSQSLATVFVLGPQRTQMQDIGYEIILLVEMAIRALSPGINDPFTAMMCIDRLGDALCQLARREMPSPYRYGAAGRLRIVAPVPSFAKLVGTAFHQIRQYGAASVSVSVRLLSVLADIAHVARHETDRAAVLRQAEAIERVSRTAVADERDRATLRERYEHVVAICSPSLTGVG